jgi:predicted amidophosphoribosyltransferase
MQFPRNLGKLLNFFHDKASFCPNCGSVIRTLPDICLCEFCWKLAADDISKTRWQRRLLTSELRERIKLDPQAAIQNKFFEVSGHSLFLWRPGRNQALSSLILALKKVGPAARFEKMADIFLQQNPNILIPNQTLLIPAPTLKPPHQDPALAWAKALSRKLGLELRNGLRKRSLQKLRLLNRHDRLQRRHEFYLENITASELVDKHVLFIDDVVTTGATALASRNLLQCHRFEVWSLAQRTRNLL